MVISSSASSTIKDYSKYIPIKNHKIKIKTTSELQEKVKNKDKPIPNRLKKQIYLKIKFKIYQFLVYLPQDKIILGKITLLKKLRNNFKNKKLKFYRNTKCPKLIHKYYKVKKSSQTWSKKTEKKIIHFQNSFNITAKCLMTPMKSNRN